MKIRPLKNNYLVKIVENEESTKSGIILAGTAREESNIAKVIETADCFDEGEDTVLKGDEIIIYPHAGTKVNLDSEEYLIISQKDVLAVLD